MRRDDVRRLAEQEATLHASLLELNGNAEKENRNLSAEEQQEFDRMITEVDDIRERRSRAEKLLVQDREIQRTLNMPIEQRVAGSGDAMAAETLQEWRNAQGLGISRADQPEYRNAFWHHLTAQAADLDVEEQRALSKGTATAGGYLLPTSLANQMIRAQRDFGSIAALCNEIVTDGGETLNVPANTAHGTMSWTSEGSAYTPSDETFANVALGAYKGTTKIIVAEELVQDASFDLEAFLATEFGERFAVGINTALMTGDGSGKPTGILSSATASNVTTSTAATGNATSFTYDALVTGIFALPRQYRRNAAFVVADTSARNLYLMKDTQGRPLWSVNVSLDGPDTFLGYPIYTDPDLPTAAANNISVLFGDFKRGYAVRRVRNALGIQRQNELHSDNGQIGFRAYQRVDGKVTLAAAIIALKHSAT